MARSSKSVVKAEVASAAIGAAIGGVIAMLFSPRSGKQNRALIAKEGRKVVSTAKRTVRKAKSKAKKVK